MRFNCLISKGFRQLKELRKKKSKLQKVPGQNKAVWDIHQLLFTSAKPVRTVGFAKRCQSGACSSLRIWQRGIIYQMGL